MTSLPIDRKIANGDAESTPRHRWVSKPVTVFLIILLIVFTVDAIEDWYIPEYVPFLTQFPVWYYDPIFTTLFIAPILWWLVFRPMQRSLQNVTVRHEAVASQVVDAVVTIDMQGVIISFNPAAEKIFGYSPEEIRGENAAKLFCDASLSAENLTILAGAENLHTALIHQVTCHRKDGPLLKLEISVSRLMLEGKPQFLVIMRDVTQRVEMERDARDIQARLIETNKMTSLGLMVSGVAHEINNPNNYILSNAQLMERSCADIIHVLREYQQENGDFLIGGLPFAEMEKHFPEMITGIIDGTQRISCIINDLKTFVRKGAENQFVELDLNQSIITALNIVDSQINRYTNNFSTKFAEGLPKVFGNSQQIGQVIINLVINACQALPHYAAAVQLETSFDSNSQEIVIKVSDEGTGIPQELAVKISEPFFSTRHASGGTGLGLAISEIIVREHSGAMTFYPRPGGGTIFEVRLPAVKPLLAEAL